MRRLRAAWASALLLWVLGVCAGAAMAESLGQIPATQGKTLAGEPVALPADLPEGQATVLVVGFGRGASKAAQAWGKQLAEDAVQSQNLTYFVMPVLAEVPRILRGGVLRLMAASVSDRGKRSFLPITQDEAGWREVAQAQDDDVPYVLVVTAEGEVRWRRSGAITEAAHAAVKAQVRQIAAANARAAEGAAVLP